MAFRSSLLQRIQIFFPGRSGALGSISSKFSFNQICKRQFVVVAVNDVQKLQRLTESFKLSWRLRATVKSVETSLPIDKGKRFYNRRVVEALEKGDYDRAWAVVVTLHQRHSDKAVIWPYTYNLLLRHYCKRQNTLMNVNLIQVLALLDAMVAQGSADQTSFEVAMAACSRARHLRSARHVLEKMKGCGQLPTAHIYGCMINCCARKQGFVRTAERYFAEMLMAGVKPTVLVINAMLRVYSRDRRRSAMMLDLLKRARDKFNVISNTVTTRTMVYYLLSEGNVEKAVTYMHCVERESSYKNLNKLPVTRQVVNSLVDACRQRGDWKSARYALRLLQRINEVDVTTKDRATVDVSSKLANLVEKCDASFPAIVWALDEQDWSQKNQPHQKAFFKSRNLMESIERALEKYDMNAAVRAPSSISRLSLNLDGKLLVLEELINAKSARLDDFNAVLGACGKQGWSADAKTVLNKMFVYAESFPHCAPTAWSFNALLNSCAAQGDVHELESILKDMINNELQPDQVTMNTLLKAFIKNLRKYNNGNNKKRFRTVVHALSFFKWCTEDLKLDPDAATFYSLFRLFSTYLETFDDSSVAVVYETETQMFDDFEENEEGDMVSQDRELMVWMSDLIATTCRDAPAAALDIGVFNNAFDYYRKLGDVDQTFALYNIMRKREIQPNDLTLGLLFATCAIQQQFEKGLKFLDHLMTSDGYMPSLKALTGAMQLYANARNPDGALGIIRAMETSKAFTLTTETYEPVVFAYARVGNVISAWEIAEEIQEKFGRVSINIYNRVLLACAEAALPGRALDVLSLIRSEENVTLDIISFNTTLDAFVRAGMRAAWSRKTHKYTLESDEQANYAEHKRVDNRNGYEHEMDGEYQRGRMVNSDNSDQTIEIEGKELEATLLRKDELNQRMKAAWVRASVIGLLEEMQEIRVKPDLTSYEHAIAACNVNKDFEGVIAIFDRLIRRKRCNDVIDLKSKLVSESSLAAYISACTATRDKNRIVEAPTLLHKWHLATGNIPPEFVVTQLLKSLETLGEWRCAVRMLPDWQVLFGIPPGVAVFNKVMEMCNNAEKHELVAPIFITMQGLAVYRIIPDVDSYIERIYAEEQRENWVIATDLFVEMQQRFSTEEISHYQLRKLNLGRYSLRQKEH